jgi:hypothetical protein
MTLFLTARPWNFTICFAFVHVQLVLAADCAGALDVIAVLLQQ